MPPQMYRPLLGGQGARIARQRHSLEEQGLRRLPGGWLPLAKENLVSHAS